MDSREWHAFDVQEHPDVFPQTCFHLSRISMETGVPVHKAILSVMQPGAHIQPHCGPTNARLRVHLALRIPPGTALRVGTETRSWQQGRAFVIDDSFEHEAWHNGTEPRVVLILEFPHPDVSFSS